MRDNLHLQRGTVTIGGPRRFLLATVKEKARTAISGCATLPVVHSAQMSGSSGDPTRRSFLQATLAGTALSLTKGTEMTAPFSTRQGETATSGGKADDLTRLTLREASDLVRAKKASPVDLTKACLTRIERANPTLNCFITITADSALQQARDAEAEIARGKWRGPLHGVPIALKDLFDTAGVKTTAGSGVFKDRIPTEDAEVVRRLKAAGAVLLGKTNMQEFAFGGTSLISYFGAVRNPWELGHIAGGSSGGSAAAVAAELCYGALGSDTAGSVRLPASHCGIAGLKPTYGLVSIRGVIPLSWSLDHVGPIARTVADTAILLQAIAGYDEQDTTSEKMHVPDYSVHLGTKVSSVRIGVPREFFFANLDPEIEASMREALSVLEKLTAGLKDVALHADKMESLRDTVRAAEAYAYHREYVAKTPELYQPLILKRIQAGANVTTPAYIQGRRDLAEVRRKAEKWIDGVDVLVTPTLSITTATVDDPHADDILPTVRNTSPFDVNGWPAISVPCGFTSKGLPMGLQIIGPKGGEAVVFQVAHAYEQATDSHKRRPQLPTQSASRA
jgi:aspartyl-tRNA(Asn)/glutamyl-tRNA(Gln) amidotransferase subunit A